MPAIGHRNKSAKAEGEKELLEKGRWSAFTEQHDQPTQRLSKRRRWRSKVEDQVAAVGYHSKLKKLAGSNSDGCPAGQAMARVSGEKVGCMTPAQYKPYEAQMRAAYRRPAPVGGYVPNNSYQIRALQQQNLYNQHQQFRIRNGY